MSLFKPLLALSVCLSLGVSGAHATPVLGNFAMSTPGLTKVVPFSSDFNVANATKGLMESLGSNFDLSFKVKRDDWDDWDDKGNKHHNKGPKHHKNKAKDKRSFPGDRIQACISRHDNGRWSRPHPIELHMAQAGIVSDFFSIMLGTSGMHIVVNDDNFFGRIILPLNGHDLNDNDNIFYDINGRPWRISKSWKKCKR